MAEADVKKKVLIVDDVAEMRATLKAVVKSLGCVVLEASSGTQALEILRDDPHIGLILLDVMMPQVDGFQTIETINKLHALKAAAAGENAPPRPKVAFITGKKLKQDIVKGLQLKADDYIIKPIDPQILKSKIRHLLKIEETVKEDEFNGQTAVLSVHFSATLISQVFIMDMMIMELSEIGFKAETPCGFKQGVAVQLRCKDLADICPDIQDLTVTVFDSVNHTSKSLGRPRWITRFSFVGLMEETRRQVRLHVLRNKKPDNHNQWAAIPLVEEEVKEPPKGEGGGEKGL